jgi:hypothetical protein
MATHQVASDRTGRDHPALAGAPESAMPVPQLELQIPTTTLTNGLRLPFSQKATQIA